MNLLGPLLPLSFPLTVNAVMMLWNISIVGDGHHLCVGHGRVINNLDPSWKLARVGLCHLFGGLCLTRLLLGRVSLRFLLWCFTWGILNRKGQHLPFENQWPLGTGFHYEYVLSLSIENHKNGPSNSRHCSLFSTVLIFSSTPLTCLFLVMPTLSRVTPLIHSPS